MNRSRPQQRLDGRADRIAPDIEIGTPVQLSLSARHERLPSHFIGMESDRYWIVTDPLKYPASPYPVATGEPISVRYRFRGSIYGFVAELVERLEFPARLLFLRRPDFVAHHALRTTPRIACRLPCTVAAPDSGLAGRLLDISIAGCRCALHLPQGSSAAPIRSGDALLLNLKLPGVACGQIVGGEVKNLKTEPGQVRFGLHFNRLDVDAQARLSEYLESVQDS